MVVSRLTRPEHDYLLSFGDGAAQPVAQVTPVQVQVPKQAVNYGLLRLSDDGLLIFKLRFIGVTRVFSQLTKLDMDMSGKRGIKMKSLLEILLASVVILQFAISI